MFILNHQSNKALVLYNSEYYALSNNGKETLIFQSDIRGNIRNYQDVGGGNATISEVLSNFSSFLYRF